VRAAVVAVIVTDLLERFTSAVEGALDPRTEAGEFTPELRMHLLERRWGYMHRRTKKPLVRIWDKEMRLISRVENIDKWDWEELATDDGEAHVQFSGKVNDWLREIVCFQISEDEDIHVTIDPDPDKPHDWRSRWGGKVLTIEDDDTAGKASTTILNCISNRRHLKGIYLAANPIFPMEVQLPKMFLWGGGTASTCAVSTFINCFRIFSLNGFYPIPRNVFAPETWLQNLSPLNWPVQVMPVNPLLDQSRWCTIGARWKDADTVLSPAMKDAKVICRAYTWLPGDPPPYTMFGPQLAEILKPTRACVILSFENVSGVTGPTGTMLDGGLNLFAATLDDLVTETIIPIDLDPTSQEGPTNETEPFFRKLLLVAPQPTPFVYRDVGYGNVASSKRVIHKSQATDIIVGGKSPQWVNMAITFAIRYAISQLATAVFSQVPGTEGLDNLYQGQLDDVFLAFQRYVNPLRSAKTGSYAFREYFHQGSGSAYTLNAFQDLASGDRAMKPYTSMKFDVTDGQPYVLGEDFWIGDRVAAEIRGITYTDNIMALRAEGDRDSAGRIMLSFGDDEREEDPIARGFRAISNIANFAGLLAGSGDLF
jgi:hypothetical protein